MLIFFVIPKFQLNDKQCLKNGGKNFVNRRSGVNCLQSVICKIIF